MKSLPFLLAALTIASPAAENAAWPLWRGTPDMRGIASVSFSFPLRLAWKYAAGKPIKATAVSDGTCAYVGDGSGKFFALQLSDGVKKWEYAIKDPIEGSAAVVGDLVVFGGGDGGVHALTKTDGKPRWKTMTDGEIKGAINVFERPGQPPLLLVGSYDNQLYALNSADGAKVWTVPTSNYINGAAALAGNRALFGGCDGFLYLVNAETGREEGKVEVKDPIANTVATNGAAAFLGHYGNAVLAVDLASRQPKWTFAEKDFPYFSSPALTEDSVLVGDRGKYLRCLSAKVGDEKWAFRATGRIDSSPVVAGQAVIVGSDDGRIYAVNLADGAELWHYEIGPPVQTSPCIAAGRLIMGADDGVIYCFTSGK
ncbi:MAG: PQQ-binding-like beta-propeller repeat protein [Verrucomicrobiales bacterium]|nr:PQQ-binding-like beta-propeller repeat protein [Verrucomicrobiales bacterium]